MKIGVLNDKVAFLYTFKKDLEFKALVCDGLKCEKKHNTDNN